MYANSERTSTPRTWTMCDSWVRKTMFTKDIKKAYIRPVDMLAVQLHQGKLPLERCPVSIFLLSVACRVLGITTFLSQKVCLSPRILQSSRKQDSVVPRKNNCQDRKVWTDYQVCPCRCCRRCFWSLHIEKIWCYSASKILVQRP